MSRFPVSIISTGVHHKFLKVGTKRYTVSTITLNEAVIHIGDGKEIIGVEFVGKSDAAGEYEAYFLNMFGIKELFPRQVDVQLVDTQSELDLYVMKIIGRAAQNALRRKALRDLT